MMERGVVYALTLSTLTVLAMCNQDCFIGTEDDPRSGKPPRWFLPYKDPCKCPAIRLGGMNIPSSSYLQGAPYYLDGLFLSEDPEEIRIFFGCPTEEKQSTDDPATKKQFAEELTTEEPTTEEQSTEEPRIEEPSTEEPRIEEPTTEDSTPNKPTTKEQTPEEPTTEEPTTEESIIQEPTNEAPTTGEQRIEEPTTEEPTTGEPTTEEPTTEEPKIEEPTTEEPTTEEPTTGEPTTEEPTTEEPTTEEPTTEEPITEEPTTEEPTTEEPTTEEPTTEEPTTEEPTTEAPTTEEPTKKEPTTEEPWKESRSGCGLGMESGVIRDDSITSSDHRYGNVASGARLNANTFWEADSATCWIEVELAYGTVVSGVITQGDGDSMWVTTYNVQYKQFPTGSPLKVLNANGNQDFDGNTDATTAVTNMFYEIIKGTVVRIWPSNWQGGVRMRLELLGIGC